MQIVCTCEYVLLIMINVRVTGSKLKVVFDHHRPKVPVRVEVILPNQPYLGSGSSLYGMSAELQFTVRSIRGDIWTM
jgi:hypothetical protein